MSLWSWILLLQFVSVALLLWLLARVYLQDRLPRHPTHRARAIAEYELSRLSCLPRFVGLRTSSMFRLGDARGGHELYDVKLIDANGGPSGYLVVSVDPDDLPVLELSLRGPSLVEQLQAQSRGNQIEARWLGPTCSVGLDTRGKIVALVGVLPAMSRDAEMKPFERIAQDRRQLRERHEKAIAARWRRRESGGGKKSSELDRDRPSGNYIETNVDGIERQPLLEQIPPNSGLNDHDYSIGCGPVAWATMLAWHNLHWTPELLRGSQPQNSIGWGDEDKWETFIDQVVVGLHDELGTYGLNWFTDIFADGSVGYTNDSDMKKGFDYLEDTLGFDYDGDTDTDASLQSMYDYIVQRRRPQIVKLPSHFAVASGFLFDDSGDDEHWIRINTGWGTDKYIAAEHYEEKRWYLTSITPKRATLPRSALEEPALVVFQGRLHLFYTAPSERICRVDGPLDGFPDIATEHVFDGLRSRHRPAVATDEKYLYMAYVAIDGTVRLVSSTDGVHWAALPLPQIRSDVAPALLATSNRLTLAICDRYGDGIQIISSTEFAQRWPQNLLANVPYGYWRTMGLTETTTGLSIAEFHGDRVALVWTDRSRNELWGYHAPVARPGAPQDWEFIGPIEGASSSGSLTFANKTLYLVSGDLRVSALASMSSGAGFAMFAGFPGGGGPTSHWLEASDELAHPLESSVGLRAVTSVLLPETNSKAASRWLVTAWLGTGLGHSITLRRFSIDRQSDQMDYAGHTPESWS